MPELAWIEGKAEGTLESFLAHNPPSKTFMPKGGDGWIWVRSNREREVEGGGSSASVKEAQEALDGLIHRFAEIENNPKIPKNKSKTSGPSKKMMRESAAQQTEQKLRDLGKHWPCGKWLFYERANFVDLVFSKLAKSIIDGPLSKLPNAKCHTVKVSTADDLHAPSSSSSNYRKEPTSVICLYFDVVWNREHAKEVLECVVKEHGELPNSAKADLYTLVKLDSHHPSKLRSTLYRPAEIFNDEVMKEWQAEFRAQQKRKAEGIEGDEKSKRRVSENGHVVPVKPEDYWANSKDEEDDDDGDFEETTKPETTKGSNGKKEEVSAPEAKEESSPINDSGSKMESDKTSDSDSETEEEEEIIMTNVTKKKSSPIKEISDKYPIASARQATPPSPPREAQPIKQTIMPIKAITKKRDRFGRSDF